MNQAIAAFGYFGMIFLAWLMSAHRSKFPVRIVIWGTVLQLGFAALILKTKPGARFFDAAGAFFTRLINFVEAGSSFVFGENFANHIFAFKVLPTIIFFSALMSVLYHAGVMQLVVRFLARIMQATLKTSGAESLSAAANIFVGQTEAPLVVKPYVASMTLSELMAVMVGGFATIAGSVMGIYVTMGVSAAHLMTASVISAPAGLLIAKVLQPEVETPKTLGDTGQAMPRTSNNLIEAITNGASDGLSLMLNVAAMLIAFSSLIALVDYCLSETSILLMTQMGYKNPTPVTLSTALGYLFAPLAWMMGVAWNECLAVGELLGIKMVATEFVAYKQLGTWIGSPDNPLSERSVAITTYALCGFSNFASIGIQIGGIGAMAPERRGDLTRIAFRAMLGGTLACCMTGCIASILL